MSENMDNKPTGQPTPTPSGQPMGQPQQPQTATPPAAQPQPVVQQPVTPLQPAVQQPAAQALAAPVQATAQPTATSAKSTAEPSEKPAPPKTQATGGDNKTNNPDNKKKKKKRKSDWGGRLITAIISIILGFVLGVGSVFGTVTAIIYSIGTQPVDETVELVDTIVPGLNLSELLFDNESGILSEEYAHKKIMDLVGDVADAISGLASEETTIKNITDLSPYVGVQLRKLLDTVKTDFGIPLDYDTLLNTKITGGVDEEGSLVKQLLEDVMNTELCALLDTFLGEEAMNPILKYLCYGKEGVDYTLDENGKPQPIEEGAKFLTIKDLASEGGEEVLYGLEIAALLSINEYDPTDPIHSILFKDGVDENGNDVKIPLVINDLIHDSESVVNGIKITGILGITEYDPEDPIHSILFKDGVDENGNDVKVPVSVGDFMTDSESIINGIKIANILGETEYDSTDPIHAILFKDDENGEKVPVSVGDFVNDSQTIINNIKIAEILGETKYDPTNSMHAILFKDGENGEKVPVTVQDLTGEFIDNIKVAEILGETKYDATNPMHAILFKDSTDADGNPVKVPVALKDLTGDFINNIKVAEILGVSADDDNTLTSILFDEEGNALTISDLSELNLNDIKLSEILTLKKGTSEVLLSIVFKGEYKLDGEDDDAVYVPVDDKEENASRTIGELTTDMTSIINGIELDSVITVGENTHPALLSIIYVDGDTDKPRTIEMLSTDSGSIINGLKLSDVIGESNTSPVIKSLLTTTDSEGSTIDTTLAHLTDAEQSKKIINNIKLSDVIDESTASPVIKSLLTTTDDEGNEIPTTLAHLTDSAQSEKLINGIKLSDVIDESTANPVIKSLLTTTDDEGNEIPTTLAHLTDSAQSEKLINGIKLADVIETDDALLKSILYVDSDESNPRTLGDFKGDGAQNIINAIKLADVLGITEDSHAALIFLAYGSNKVTDTPRTLGEIRTMGDDLINDIPLSYIITPDMNSTIVCYLLYGKAGIHYTMQTKVENGATIKYADMLQRHIIIEGGLAYNAYGESISSASYTLNGTSTYTELNGEGDEDNVTYNLTAGTRADGTAVYYLSDSAGEPVMFTETTLKQFSGSSNSLTKLTSRLTVGDILGEEIDGNPMLKHLAGTPIDQLSTAVGELSFGQVFEDQIYRTYKEGDSYVDSNGETVNVGDYIDYDGNKILYDPDSGVDNRVLGDIWHYMLTGEDEYGNKYNAAYEYSVVNDMDKLIENMKREVHDAQLKQLAHDGILNLSDDILNREIILQIADYPVNTTHPSGTLIGDLTTEQMLIYVEELLKAVDYVNSLA